EIAVSANKGQPSDNVLDALAYVVAAVSDLHKLYDRVEALEQRPELKHVGPWREGRTYRERHRPASFDQKRRKANVLTRSPSCQTTCSATEQKRRLLTLFHGSHRLLGFVHAAKFA